MLANDLATMFGKCFSNILFNLLANINVKHLATVFTTISFYGDNSLVAKVEAPAVMT